MNLSLLVLFPVAWMAPLVRAGLLPIFGMSEISVLSGLTSLWETDRFLASVVALFALLAPLVKTICLAMIHFGRLSPRALPVLGWMGKLAMADVFLIALYITVIKSLGVGRVETAWGLYMFTACIFLSLWISLWTKGKFDAGAVGCAPARSRQG
ncbi:paraquat-inducible protein A [Pseudooceanicola sp. C21-150M6]|uniref:paraquat-inducible protein A n=1 Tax=Pseudooceanicola sp. C21-150M6 TaxID=3434355 RepID=UPI003D7FAAE4